MQFGEKKLDKNVPIPLYFQLKEMVVAAIKEGSYPRDSLLPTEKEFSEIFGISRTTVRQAITELVQEGWLYRVKSKGTFVSTPKINQDFISKLVTFPEEMKRSGKVPRTEVLELKTIPAVDGIASALQIDVGAKVIYLYRRRFADEEPIVIVETYLPYEDCAFVMQHDLEKNSLYDVMSEKEETEVYCVKRQVEAVEAKACDTKYLDIKKGKPVQLFRSLGYNVYGKPVEYSIARYRADRNSFEVTVFADQKK
ncbi:MAG: GntR family transcriptional regulator [Lachnospiraceae bacterium]|nr:GntR family transcriptional regulator [Lachnospiraceae bacterium]MDD3794381.1 GntR family transcriptional regulator [Lachnospiraceae bacterium]